MTDSPGVLTTTEISSIIDPQGNLLIGKTTNKEIEDQSAHTEIINNEIIDRPAHTDKTISQIDSPAPIETMITETDQTVRAEINTDQITNITGLHRHITTKTIETTLLTTVSNRTSNIEGTTEEEAIHHYRLQPNQEPTVDQITEEP
jgi:hypothetical protein